MTVFWGLSVEQTTLKTQKIGFDKVAGFLARTPDESTPLLTGAVGSLPTRDINFKIFSKLVIALLIEILQILLNKPPNLENPKIWESPSTEG